MRPDHSSQTSRAYPTYRVAKYASCETVPARGAENPHRLGPASPAGAVPGVFTAMRSEDEMLLRIRFSRLAFLLILVLLLSGCASITLTPAPVTLPNIESFSASPPAITAGETTTLSWVMNTPSTTLSLDHGIGILTGATLLLKPSETTTYTLTATNKKGSISRSLTVAVVAAPVILSFTADPTLLSPATTGPSAATLSWTVRDASTVSITPGIGPVTLAQLNVNPSVTTSYTLAAANSLGATVTANLTVQVRTQLNVLAGRAFAGTSRAQYLHSLGACAAPYFLATDAAGNIYATDRYTDAICRFTPTGFTTILAGNAGDPSPGGALLHRPLARASSLWRPPGLTPARTALLPSPVPGTRQSSSVAPVNAGLVAPSGIAVTADGSTIYFADFLAPAIRKITFTSDGVPVVSTIAGGQWGYLDGPGTTARFAGPSGLALDAMGNLYVADSLNCVIRKLTIASDGSTTTSTLAGNHTCGYIDGVAAAAELGNVSGLAVSLDGSAVYISDQVSLPDPATGEPVPWSTLRKITMAPHHTATVSTVAGAQPGYADGPGSTAAFDAPSQIALSADAATLYVADTQNSVLRQIALHADGTATVSTVAGFPKHLLNWDGTGAAASFVSPTGIALDRAGNAYVSQGADPYGAWYGNAGEIALRKVALDTGQVSTLLLNIFGNTGGGDDGPGTQASFNIPTGLAVAPDGSFYLADSLNGIIRNISIAPDGTATVSTLAGTPSVRGSADGFGPSAQFDQPVGIAIDPSGNHLFVADAFNATIRRVDLSTGATTTVLGFPGRRGYSDASPVLLAAPRRLAFDSTGLLYILDQDLWSALRTYDPKTGALFTLAFADSSGGILGTQPLTSLATWSNADRSKRYLYLAARCAIFRIDLSASTPTATVYAGSSSCGYQDGLGGDALFSEIWDIAADSQGTLYVADSENSLIRRIAPDGRVTTLAGTYGRTDYAPATLPGSLFLPLAVAVDRTDNLLIAVPNAILTLQP